jgi:hypothetical protein
MSTGFSWKLEGEGEVDALCHFFSTVRCRYLGSQRSTLVCEWVGLGLGLGFWFDRRYQPDRCRCAFAKPRLPDTSRLAISILTYRVDPPRRCTNPS